MQIGYLENFTSKEMILLYYLISINIISFVAMGIDKMKAKKDMYRISENFLIILSIVGGAIGELLGMILFRHKTSKKKFYIGVPIIYIITKVITVIMFNYLR